MDGNLGAFCDEDVINGSVQDDSAFALLNDIGQDSEGRRRVILAVDEHLLGRAFTPLDTRSMDCILNFGTVEVDGTLLVGEGSGETKGILYEY